MPFELNLRDLGDIACPAEPGNATGHDPLPKGMYLRSGKLSLLSEAECAALCRKYNIRCVIDLRTPVEASEFPDPLPPGVEYLQIPILSDSTIGITHETGSDPMTILRNLRRHPETLRQTIPDFKALYIQAVTDPYSRSQLDRAVAQLRQNAQNGICTLFHCTAGKDRTGIVSMALLKSYGIPDEQIIRDYMATNRSAFLPTLRKCLAVALLTWSPTFVKTAYKSFMAQREHIEIAIEHYDLGK